MSTCSAYVGLVVQKETIAVVAAGPRRGSDASEGDALQGSVRRMVPCVQLNFPMEAIGGADGWSPAQRALHRPAFRSLATRPPAMKMLIRANSLPETLRTETGWDGQRRRWPVPLLPNGNRSVQASLSKARRPRHGQ